MKKWIKGLSFGLLGMSWALGGSLQAVAVPADSESTNYKQPSGELFQAQIVGDEYLNYVLANETGDLISLGKDNYWYYSILDEATKQTEASEQKYMIDRKPENALTYKDIDKLERIEENTEEIQKTRSSAQKWNKEQPLLVVLVEFEDKALTYSEDDWSKRVFSKTEKSLHTYYKEATKDSIHITAAKEKHGKADGVVRVKLNRKHPNSGNTYDLARPVLKEALEAIQGSVDISEYDTNKNGIIEQNELHIMGIFAGYENSSISSFPNVWGHKGSYQGRPIGYPMMNGVKVNHYTLFGETMLNKTTNTEYQSELGLVAHEFGHDLKLPDLYNEERTIIQQDGKFIQVANGDGLGKYSLMASGSWTHLSGENPGTTPPHLDAYSKVALGIVTPKVITEAQTVDIKSIEDSGFNIFRLNSEDPQEYFLIENRQLTGMDAALKTVTRSRDHGEKSVVASGGIGIYQINERYTRNVSANKQLVTLKEADEGILGYSKLNQPRYYATNNYDGFYYKGIGGHGKEQQTILSPTTTPSTAISNSSYPKYSILVNSEPATSMSVTFKGKSIAVESISINPSKATMEIGDTKQLLAEMLPKNADNQTVRWSSSNESVATVSESGVVTAKTKGNAEVTATTEDGNKTATANITVSETSAGDSFERAIPMNLNQVYDVSLKERTEGYYEFTPTTTGIYGFVSEVKMNWEGTLYNSEKRQLIYNSSGNTFKIVREMKAGETYYLKVGNCGNSGENRIRVYPVIRATGLTIGSPEITLKEGEQLQLNSSFTPSNTTEDVALSWSSSDPAIVKVNAFGKLEAKGTSGSVTITAKGKNAIDSSLITSITVTVIPNKTGESFERAIPMDINQVYDVSLKERTEGYYEFTPTTTGIYGFVSEVKMNWEGTLYNSEKRQLIYNSSGNTFKIVREMEAGETYYLKVGNCGTSGENKIRVYPVVRATGLTIGPSEITLKEGEQLQLNSSLTPANTTEDAPLSWSSSDPTIVKVNAFGKLEAKGASGSVTITAKGKNAVDSSLKTSITVTVTPK